MPKSSMKIGRILTGGVAALVLSYLAVTIVITGYAFKLGFEARGAPDQQKIADFAAGVAPALGMILGFVFAMLAAWWVARKADASRLLHGILVGIVVAVIDFVISVGGGSWLSPGTLAGIALAVAGGYLGGRLAGTPKAASPGSLPVTAEDSRD